MKASRDTLPELLTPEEIAERGLPRLWKHQHPHIVQYKHGICEVCGGTLVPPVWATTVVVDPLGQLRRAHLRHYVVEG